MQFIYDHLSASILGIAIFFILVAVQVRGTETSNDQTQYYSAKAQLLDLKEMIEHDFKNIGAGVSRYDPIFVSKDDSTFEFMAKVQATDEEPSKITYRRVATERVTIDDETVQLYEVQRLVDDVLTGKGPATMKEFVVELRDGNREEVADFEDVETVYVRFVIVPPLRGEDGLHEARWNRTIRPPNLSNF